MKWEPCNRKTTFTNLKKEKRTPPKIIFSTTALKWIDALVNQHDHEIGFYAVVDTRAKNEYFIRDVFYPKHDEANGATCEISPDGETQIMNYLIDKEKIDDIAKLRFWGHSHHNMGTGPSGQDESQAMERMNSTQAFFIRAICNKKGEMSISFFDFDNQVRFDNIKWETEEVQNEKSIVEKLNKIKILLTDDFTQNTSEIFETLVAILITDDEVEKIKAKVASLKKENLPVVRSYNGSIQGDMFNRSFPHPKAPFKGTTVYDNSYEMKRFKKLEDDKGDEYLDPEILHAMMGEIDDELIQFEEEHSGTHSDEFYAGPMG